MFKNEKCMVKKAIEVKKIKGDQVNDEYANVYSVHDTTEASWLDGMGLK